MHHYWPAQMLMEPLRQSRPGKKVSFVFFAHCRDPHQSQARAFKHEFKRCQPLCLARQLFHITRAGRRAWAYNLRLACLSVSQRGGGDATDNARNFLVCLFFVVLMALRKEKWQILAPFSPFLFIISGGNRGLLRVGTPKHLA